MSGYPFVPRGPLFVQSPYPNTCNPCAEDPLYNPPPCPPLPCPPCNSCSKSCKKEYKCNKCCAPAPPCGPCGPCGPAPGPCGPEGCPKDPCPLKSFCDPGLTNTCIGRPIINPNAPRVSVTTWKINYLVSNIAGVAANLDTNLINPWGIVVYNNQLWVVNGTSDGISNYDLFGNRISNTTFALVRDAAHNSAFPTGLAINCGGGFPIVPAGNNAIGFGARSALLLTASEFGTVHAYSPLVNNNTTYLVLNMQLTGKTHIYKGIAIANNTLYLPDFYHGTIDVFDSSYNQLVGFHFIDGDTSDPIPLNYGPNNIVHIGCYLYILYARRDDVVTTHDLDGPGHGFISVFNLDGSFVRRFTSRGVLNSPWAMIPAPCECGFPPGSFLVGNNGDGRINVFDCNGRYVGPMLSQSGLPIVIPGLWGLAPHYVDFSQIFFTSSADEDTLGLVGSLVKDQVIQF